MISFLIAMISGFMIVKDVIKQGYPFVEAVAAALPICDEFLISEGYSTDGTYEVINQLSRLNKKIKVFRQEWPASKKPSVLAEVTNAIRRKCKFNYIFYVQANEIVHEDNLEYIESLPEMCPQIQTFSFPYLHLVGNYKFGEDFRLRFAKNLPEIVAIWDACTLGLSRTFIISEILKNLRNPRKLRWYMGRGIEWNYANCGTSLLSKAMYLPKPIFRYWSFFPQNFLEKCAQHAEKFNLPEFDEIRKLLEKYIGDYSSFWEKALELARSGAICLPGFNYPASFGVVNEKDHPRLIQGIISDAQAKAYYVREEILNLIKEL